MKPAVARRLLSIVSMENNAAMNSLFHPDSRVESTSIGAGTRIWSFAHVLPGAVIGSDCNICDHTFIENDVVIGDRVTVKCGVQLWDGVTLEDDVFVGPNATFTNDPFPRSCQRPDVFTRTLVRKGASIGANSTILPGIVIGAGAMVGAGAVVTGSVPPNAIVVGNPARISGYVSEGRPLTASNESPSGKGQAVTVSGGARLIDLPVAIDLRGTLSFCEFGQHLPFVPQRYFVVYDVPSKHVRGEHAHKKLEQFLVCVRGGCSVVVDNGTDRSEIRLDSPSMGLYLPAMTWATQYRYSTDAVLLVLASAAYDSDDYIRNYDEYLALVRD
jgi:acetyltransferase-like isoleucine patch superfamily enzyme/dTDP-4-dehydrorhamnose 3,5-epimerase-like enzyme